MEHETQLKSFIRVKITYYNSKPFVYAMFDNDGDWIKLDNWDANNTYVSIPRDEDALEKYGRKLRKAKSIKIKLKSNVNVFNIYDTEVDNVGIVYRTREFFS